jgi:2-keto-4-pentenoate hydratase/2-oxohepta-3-ene-1,7-dioic acid hydratase in catechol pathway
MNAAVNFYTHACEGCTEEELAERTRERQENRGVPYLFLKPTRGAVIGTARTSSCPTGVTEIEYEVEMAIVFGRTGKYISAAARTTTCSATWSRWTSPTAAGGRRGATAPAPTGSSERATTRSRPRARGSSRRSSTGTRWSSCTSRLVIDGVTVQEARAGDMIHSSRSSSSTPRRSSPCFPGDVLQSGTSGGTGAGRVERATGSGYLVDGETIRPPSRESAR